jgi:hypothetical protein
VLQAQQKAIEAENRQKEAVAESKQKLDCAQANFLKLTEMAKLEADMNVKQKEVLYDRWTCNVSSKPRSVSSRKRRFVPAILPRYLS